MASPAVSPNVLNSPYTLPCGLRLNNRLIKAAMAEDLALVKDGSRPNERHLALYESWSQGGWGMILTGNVEVDTDHLGGPGDIALPRTSLSVDPQSLADSETIEAWKMYAATIQSGGTPALVQINHPGRQSPFIARKKWEKAIAPSAIALNFGPRYIDRAAVWAAFGTPRAMTKDDIELVKGQFVRAAKLSELAGFKGVELHAAHGYLLSTFLLAESNQRSDEYGGSAVNRARMIKEIAQEIRKQTKPGFCVGLKLNSADVQKGDEEDGLEQIGYLTKDGLFDFLEISGGSYENPRMIQGDAQPAAEISKSERTKTREAFFIRYAGTVRERFPDVPLMVTGGFRTRQGMQAAVSEGGCDLVGVGRASVIEPQMPRKIILKDDLQDREAIVALDNVKVPWLMQKFPVKQLGAGAVTKAYQDMMAQSIRKV